MRKLSTIYPSSARGDSISFLPANGRGSHWQRFFDLLARSGVPEKYRPWYARHVKALLVAFPGRKLTDLTTEEITSYLRDLARESGKPVWRLRQQVDAIRLLLVDLVRPKAARRVDWAF